jgi:hypothetical protein
LLLSGVVAQSCDEWRCGVITFYGLLALLVLAVGATEHLIDAKQTKASVQTPVASTATRTP